MTCQSMHERNKNNLINFEFKKSQRNSSVLHYCPEIIKIWSLKLINFFQFFPSSFYVTAILKHISVVSLKSCLLEKLEIQWDTRHFESKFWNSNIFVHFKNIYVYVICNIYALLFF